MFVHSIIHPSIQYIGPVTESLCICERFAITPKTNVKRLCILPISGILKNKITYPPPLTDKNMKNRLREKLSDYNPPTISSSIPPPVIPPSKTPSVASNDGVHPVSVGKSNSVIIKPLIAPRPQLPQNGGVAMSMKAITTNGGNESDSEWVVA